MGALPKVGIGGCVHDQAMVMVNVVFGFVKPIKVCRDLRIEGDFFQSHLSTYRVNLAQYWWLGIVWTLTSVETSPLLRRVPYCAECHG
jgi:hypothetical protein